MPRVSRLRRTRLGGPALGAPLALALALACAAPAPSTAGPGQMAAAPPPSSAPVPATGPGPDAPSARPQAPPQKVTLGIPAKSLNFLTMYLGTEMGLFAEEGLDVDISVMQTPTTIAGIVSGSLDYSGAVSGTVRAAMTGAPVRAIAFGTVHPTFFLMSKPEIRSLVDLRHKVVATTSLGSNQTHLTRAAVARVGLDPQNDVSVIGAGNAANAYAALLAGQADAAVLSIPFNVQAEREGYYPLLYAGDVTSSPESGLGASLDRLREQPDQVKRLLRGLLKADRYVREQKPVAVELIARDFDVDRDLADGAYDAIVRAYSPNGEMDRAALEEFMRDFRAQEGIAQEFAVEDVIDFGPLREARRELGR